MAEIVTQQIVKAGVEPTYSAVSSFDNFENYATERTFLHVKNGDTSSTIVTISPITSIYNYGDFGTTNVPTITITILAGEERMIGPFPAAYIDSDNKTTVEFSNTTNVTASALRLPSDSF